MDCYWIAFLLIGLTLAIETELGRKQNDGTLLYANGTRIALPGTIIATFWSKRNFEGDSWNLTTAVPDLYISDLSKVYPRSMSCRIRSFEIHEPGYMVAFHTEVNGGGITWTFVNSMDYFHPVSRLNGKIKSLSAFRYRETPHSFFNQ